MSAKISQDLGVKFLMNADMPQVLRLERDRQPEPWGKEEIEARMIKGKSLAMVIILPDEKPADLRIRIIGFFVVSFSGFSVQLDRFSALLRHEKDARNMFNAWIEQKVRRRELPASVISVPRLIPARLVEGFVAD